MFLPTKNKRENVYQPDDMSGNFTLALELRTQYNIDIHTYTKTHHGGMLTVPTNTTTTLWKTQETMKEK